jgi:hypothetical protein
MKSVFQLGCMRMSVASDSSHPLFSQLNPSIEALDQLYGNRGRVGDTFIMRGVMERVGRDPVPPSPCAGAHSFFRAPHGAWSLVPPDVGRTILEKVGKPLATCKCGRHEAGRVSMVCGRRGVTTETALRLAHRSLILFPDAARDSETPSSPLRRRRSAPGGTRCRSDSTPGDFR